MACTPTTFVSGGNLIVSSTSRPTGQQLFAGLTIFEADTGRELTYDGTGWVIMSEPTITTYVPTITALSGTFTTISATMRYYRSNGWLYYGMAISCTTVGSAASGVVATLPVNALAGDDPAAGFGRNPSTGIMLQATLTSGPPSSLTILTATGTFPITSGQANVVKGFYQMTTRYS